MNNKFQNYSRTKYFGLKVEAGLAIVSTDYEVGLAESIFWNNFVSVCTEAVILSLLALNLNVVNSSGSKDQCGQIARDA